MTDTQAAETYKNDYILMRFDSDDLDCEIFTGLVLGVGDEQGIYSMLNQLEDKHNCGLFTGINLQNSLGGIELIG